MLAGGKMALFTAAEAFEMAMEIEKNGEVFYNAVAAKATDKSVKTLFQELAAQEQRHYEVFQKMAGNVKDAPNLSAAEYDEYDVYLKAALDSALFAGPDKALALAEQARDRQTALRMALGFEKDTLLFFYDLREMVSEAEQKAVTGIIREEKTHLRRLAGAL
jgi:rubrerythrin